MFADANIGWTDTLWRNQRGCGHGREYRISWPHVFREAYWTRVRSRQTRMGSRAKRNVII